MRANRILFLTSVIFLSVFMPHTCNALSSSENQSNSLAGKYYNLDYGSLRFRVPEGWKNTLDDGSGKSFQTLSFTPLNGNSFQLMVSVFTKKEIGIDPKNPEAIKRSVKKKGTSLLAQAVENRLDIRELKGAHSTGYYFSLTDKAPKPGEFEFLTQGYIGLSQYLILFSVFTHNSQAMEISESLEMLRWVECTE
jgi:hypothetical protein